MSAPVEVAALEGPAARLAEFLGRARKPLVIGATLLVMGLGFLALHHLTQEVRLSAVRHAVHALPAWRIAAALALTVASYLALTLYDVVALRIIGRPLPWRTAALASFTSYTLSHNLGLGLLTGGSARYRVYSQAGLDGGDVARVVAIAGVSFWAGVFAVAGVALLFGIGPLDVAGWAVPRWAHAAAGAAVLTAIAGALFAGRQGGGQLSLFGWRLPLPTVAQGAAQVGVAAIDLLAASAALFVLVPDAAIAAWPAFFLGYAVAIIVALVSHVPGGVGVFEAVMIAALPGDPATLFAALIAYRLIYYVLPLLVAAGLILLDEGRRWHAPLGRALSGAQSVAGGIAPPLVSALVFVGGTILLISGSLPALPARLHDLHHVVPLPFIEASHIAASLAGTVLLMLAPGLYRRLDGAYFATRLLLVAGAVFSLAKGLDYEEAAVLLVVLGLMQWTRPAFYRRTALTAEPLTPAWIVAIAAAVGLSLWIGFFAYKRVAYDDALWWDFALKGDASRFLRASLAVCVMLAALAVWRLFAPARPPAHEEPLADAVAARAIAATDRTEAFLAYTGDKRFLVADSGDAFLMYQVKGSSWIVMGDPIGPREAWPDLLWTIRTRADAAQGRLLLYQVTPDTLPIAIELGLQLMKYGEAAQIDLAGFTLDGPKRKTLRHARRRADKEGLSFAVVPPDGVAALLPELQDVSDVWLAERDMTEKRFSLGRFTPDYLCRFPVAVVREGGRMVAFANLWATPNRAELSVDLMRHVRDMPYGAMDYLFTELLLWGRTEGYATFSLGLAPLSGIEARRLSPVWAKAASLVFRYGERFYGFEGLRAYKEKFGPRWEPRFIAGPRGLGLVRSLGDLQALVSG